jgi:hypothetical protein
MSKPTRSDFVLDRFKGLNELVDPVRLEPGWLDVAKNRDGWMLLTILILLMRKVYGVVLVLQK